MLQRLGASLVCVVMTSACTALGPTTIPRDRFDYNSAVADSWKQQALLNIVKLRYADNPVFLDVAQIVSGYSFESSVSGSFGHATGVSTSDSLGISAQGRFTDRPTITYTPLTGQQYMKGLIVPIAPASVLFLIQSGYAANLVLGMTVESINGLNNRANAPARLHPGDADFFRVLELFGDIQRSGALGMRIEVSKDKRETTVIAFRKRDIEPELEAKLAELRRLLRLDPEAAEYRIAFGMGSGGNQIDLTTRSVLQVMIELAGNVEVPQAHLQEGSALSVARYTDKTQPLARVRSGA